MPVDFISSKRGGNVLLMTKTTYSQSKLMFRESQMGTHWILTWKACVGIEQDQIIEEY